MGRTTQIFHLNSGAIKTALLTVVTDFLSPAGLKNLVKAGAKCEDNPNVLIQKKPRSLGLTLKIN